MEGLTYRVYEREGLDIIEGSRAQLPELPLPSLFLPLQMDLGFFKNQLSIIISRDTAHVLYHISEAGESRGFFRPKYFSKGEERSWKLFWLPGTPAEPTSVDESKPTQIDDLIAFGWIA